MGKRVARSVDYECLESATRKGGSLYLIGGRGFVRTSERGGKLYLQCRLRGRQHCKASAVLDLATDKMKALGDHTCVPEELEVYNRLNYIQ